MIIILTDVAHAPDRCQLPDPHPHLVRHLLHRGQAPAWCRGPRTGRAGWGADGPWHRGPKTLPRAGRAGDGDPGELSPAPMSRKRGGGHGGQARAGDRG
jgi:hypothetical protein